MTTKPSRRQFLAAGGAVPTLAASGSLAAAARAASSGDPPGFRYCLNFATLQGYRSPMVDMIDAAAKAGYQAVEPWVNAIHTYAGQGGALPELRRRIADAGMTVESAIAFPQWLVDDPAKRALGMEQASRDMEAVAAIGGTRIAAPPAGANSEPELPLPEIVTRYRALLELGDRLGIVPELEFWGGSVNLRQLAQAVFVAMETHHPKACVLADVFHLYKGGSGFTGLPLLGAQAVQVVHLNDYPAAPPRETITDRDRVYPGDGVAPMKQILMDLHRINPSMVLSLELFNPAYWKTTPLETARTGLAKMKHAVQAALGNA
jgi:2-keto-myo-inositol isomerase